MKDDKATRKARRQANGKSHAAMPDMVRQLAQWAKSLPEVSSDDAFAPGLVTHMCISHDNHCKTLRTGNGFDCNCDADVSFHRQPQGS
jgi:hypothetical protein